VKAALKSAAEADDRSVSSWCLRIVWEWLTAHGYAHKLKSRSRARV
jgi:hypothetical protein